MVTGPNGETDTLINIEQVFFGDDSLPVGISSLFSSVPTDGVDLLIGTEGANTIDGLAGDDSISGLGGDDTLVGGADNDILRGGNGEDVIIGGAGRDRMVGGGDADTFVFNDVSDSGVGGLRDRIDDFTQGEDVIQFTDSFVTNGSPGIDPDGAAAFGGVTQLFLIGTDDFSGTAGELRQFFAPNRTIIEGDIDGDGVADFQIELFNTNVTLTAEDFGSNLVLI